MSALKTTHEEQGGVYVGVWAQPTPPHTPVLRSQLNFFQWIHVISLLQSNLNRAASTGYLSFLIIIIGEKKKGQSLVTDP